jgi:hypothetical protein
MRMNANRGNISWAVSQEVVLAGFKFRGSFLRGSTSKETMPSLSINAFEV